jgi:hypothetical protein
MAATLLTRVSMLQNELKKNCVLLSTATDDSVCPGLLPMARHVKEPSSRGKQPWQRKVRLLSAIFILQFSIVRHRLHVFVL